MKKSITNTLLNHNCKLYTYLKTYDYSRHNLPKDCFSFQGIEGSIEKPGFSWNVETQLNKLDGHEEGYEITQLFSCANGSVKEAAVGIEIVFEEWSRENYVLMPAAAYNGNRYESRPQPYMPFFYNFEDMKTEPFICLSDVPRLNIDDGLSRIQERSGSMSTPSIGFYSPAKKMGFWLFTNQGTNFGDHGLGIEENRERDRAYITLSNPVVRELFQYNMTNTRFNTTDKPADFKKGDKLKLKYRLFFFKCQNIQQLFDFYNKERFNLSLPSNTPNALPYSEAFHVQEKKFNRQNFVEDHGYYSVGMRENACQDWQIGWVGGMITTYPLLMAGSQQTKDRVIRNFEWLFDKGIAPGGLFWGIGEKGTNFFGEFEHSKPLGKNLLLVRKVGDAIYYIIKQFMLMEKSGIDVRADWKRKLKDIINRLIHVWDKNGQLGHYLNVHTNEIAVGGSTSGGIVPAALCLASVYFNHEDFLKKAEEIGGHFYHNYVTKGISYGGVGDAMHNFDSESAYGLLESYALLHEHTQKDDWLKIAEEMGSQFATWVMSYDYQFPENTLFGELKMQTRGTVFANTQNKHLAPGICTHSGIALLRLFRATGKEFYMYLLRDMVRAIPQYLSHPQRPIPGMQDGWISERINSTDWWEPIGEIMYGSTWAETACMLSYIEIPGIYIVPDKQFIIANDNLEAKITRVGNGTIEIEVENKTNFDATTSIVVENSRNLQTPLGENFICDAEKIFVKSGETKRFKMNFV
jgi:hypothetical protein